MSNAQLICLGCNSPLDPEADACPHCSEKVTQFQRTYSGRLLDGKYQILERLGVGGMGEIFKVRHVHLGEQRVIKIMRANIAADEQALQRFLWEAKLATTVKHRNLAMLYDFSVLEDGSYYMVWEFIDGVNIQKWIGKNGPVPARLSVEIAIQALGGLEALHQMGIIHRDISPENIMLSQDHQGKLLVKVIDFGIAKQLSENESGQGLTQTGMFLGKLKYASPEQAGFIKEGEHLDARSDLYSFGIVLYEMIAGKAPFLATNPQGYILKHATEKPLPFKQFDPALDVPPQLERIVMKALEKDRADRHTNADELIEDLKAVRASIEPEERFGLGERMITLSASPTLSDSRPGITGGARTGGTRPALTLVDRTAGGQEAAATIIGGAGAAAPTRIEPLDSSAAPTMVESLGGAAPTLVESKFGAGAAPTVVERKLGPSLSKKRSSVWVGAAAAAVLVAVLAVFMYVKAKDDTALTTTATAIASITGTAADSTAAPGVSSTLVLTGSPAMQLERLEHVESGPIELAAADRQFPLRLTDMQPGTYRITWSDGSGKAMTEEFLVAGKEARFRSPDVSVDLDAVVDEILKQ